MNTLTRNQACEWAEKRLKYVVAFPGKSEVATLPSDTEVSFVPMDAVGENGGIRNDLVRPLGEVLNGFTYFRDNDIVIAKITPCFENGKGALAAGLHNGIAFGTTELHVVRAGKFLLPEFLFYTTISYRFRKLGEAEMYGAGGQKRIPERFIRDYRVSLPPLDMQELIVRFLDRKTWAIDALIGKKERLIELLRKKRQATITKAITRGLDPHVPMKPSGINWLREIPVTWITSRLRYYVKITNGFAFPSEGFTKNDERSERLLRGVNVGVGRIRWDDTVYWTREINDGLRPYELSEGDLVIGMDRPWISEGMRIAIIQRKDLPCLLLQRVARLQPSSKLLNTYLLRILASPMFVDYFTPMMTGVSVPHISPDQVLDFSIPIPPIESQRAISEFLDRELANIDSLVSEIHNGILRLKAYRSALINAAVTGQIDVTKYRGEAPCQ